MTRVLLVSSSRRLARFSQTSLVANSANTDTRICTSRTMSCIPSPHPRYFSSSESPPSGKTVSISIHPPTSPRSSKSKQPYVYYCSYGSNMNHARFACYIQGGKPPLGHTEYKGARNKKFNPEESHYVVFENELIFGGPTEDFESATWGGGGVCFVAPKKQEEVVEELLEEGGEMETPLVRDVKVSYESSDDNNSTDTKKPTPKPALVHRLLKIDPDGNAHLEYTTEENTEFVQREFEELAKTSTIGRMYKVTWEQFLDTVMQENNILENFHLFEDRSYEDILHELLRMGEMDVNEEGMYGKMILLGFHEDCPILTFSHTAKYKMIRKPPSLAYASTIGQGLTGLPGMTTKHARDYLFHKGKLQHTLEELERMIREGQYTKDNNDNVKGKNEH